MLNKFFHILVHGSCTSVYLVASTKIITINSHQHFGPINALNTEPTELSEQCMILPFRFFATLKFISNTFPFIRLDPTPGLSSPNVRWMKRMCLFHQFYCTLFILLFFRKCIHLYPSQEIVKNNGNDVCNRLTSDSSSSSLMLAQQIKSYTFVSFGSSSLHICILLFASWIPWIRKKEIADGFKCIIKFTSIDRSTISIPFVWVYFILIFLIQSA